MDYFDSNAHITTSFQSAIWITKHSIKPTNKGCIVLIGRLEECLNIGSFESGIIRMCSPNNPCMDLPTEVADALFLKIGEQGIQLVLLLGQSRLNAVSSQLGILQIFLHQLHSFLQLFVFLF